MSQTNSDIQLQVWKDLAISKQVLMGAATDALGLDAQCSTDELKEALEKAIRRANDADNSINKIRVKTEQQLNEMKQQLTAANQARSEAEEKVGSAEKAREAAETRLAAGRAENAESVKKARADVAAQQAKLKAITKALADTPENVIKKIKTLKKQKLEDARVRDLNEAQLKTLRKEKTELKAEVKNQKTLLEQAATLAAQLREVHELCKQQNHLIETAGTDRGDLADIPALDEELLKSLENRENDED